MREGINDGDDNDGDGDGENDKGDNVKASRDG